MPAKKKSKIKFTTTLARDAAFCAIFIYLVLKVIQFIPINSGWFQPVGSAFKDFDWSDIYFSKIKNLKKSDAQNPDIVIINLNKSSREEIALTLTNLDKANAKVIGLDVLFQGAKDSASDALLDHAIKHFDKKIVVACYADSTLGNNIYSLQPLYLPKLVDEDNLGYVNFIGEENSTIRTFYKVQDFRKKKMVSFAFNTFIKFKGDFNAYKDELVRDESIIAYQSLPEHFTTLDYREILDTAIDLRFFNDKIVLLGFAGFTDGFAVIDDKHFTPLNENYAGKALPDMFGVYIHANIIASYIDEYKIYSPPVILHSLLCIVFLTLFLMLYLYSEFREHVWQNVVELSLQLLFAFVIIILAIYFLSSHGIKWDIGEMIAAIALAEPLVGVYRVIIYFLAKVYRFNSIFLNED